MMKPYEFTILVVDDMDSNLDVLVEILSDAYNVRVALDGASALDNIAKSLPDLILLDVMMPGMDGFQVCRKIKSNPQTRQIPVIFLTALTEERDEEKGLELGGVDYIIKPFRPQLVKARIKNHLELKKYQDRLEELVHERTLQLQQAMRIIKDNSLDTIHRLSIAAEYKDQDTGAHILWMSNYSAAISRQMGLGDKVAQWILYAAPMHDVGKIGIPDRVLNKPGQLNSEEWQIMKQHTSIGKKILYGGHKGYLKLAEIIAYTHHEKWDGSGYPNGPREKEIPRISQIVAIADVFDALTSKRPYKDPFPVDKALNIIEESRGTHFDPRVVDAFFGIQKEIITIKEKYKDLGTAIKNPQSYYPRLEPDS